MPVAPTPSHGHSAWTPCKRGPSLQPSSPALRRVHRCVSSAAPRPSARGDSVIEGCPRRLSLSPSPLSRALSPATATPTNPSANPPPHLSPSTALARESSTGADLVPATRCPLQPRRPCDALPVMLLVRASDASTRSAHLDHLHLEHARPQPFPLRPSPLPLSPSLASSSSVPATRPCHACHSSPRPLVYTLSVSLLAVPAKPVPRYACPTHGSCYPDTL